jgi:hypothetical protein
MLATLLGPLELEAPGVPVDVPQAASVMAAVTMTIGKRFIVFLPFRLCEPEMKTLPEL